MTKSSVYSKEFLSASRPALVLQRLRNSGITSVANLAALRISQRMEARLNWRDLDFPLRKNDVVDSESLSVPVIPARKGPLRIGWVCAAPSPGSGGHTTLFRAVKALEDRGHECTLFLYDRDSDDVSRHAAVIRRYWPELAAEVRSATPCIENMDAVVASSWATAHVVASRERGTARKFYFIQDYEPYFYPRGDLYALAEDTYRFGFTNIALGKMVATRLKIEAGVTANYIVPFGCDTTIYRHVEDTNRPPRNGVVFYAKPNSDRRGYNLGKLALEELYKIYPEQTIHVVGGTVAGWKMPVVNHGNIGPRELNAVFNSCIAGIALSFTNISLMAEELLAAGCIPIVNDSPMARADLASPFVVWAKPTPFRIAEAVSRTLARGDSELLSVKASSSTKRGWADTQALIAEAIEKGCAS